MKMKVSLNGSPQALLFIGLLLMSAALMFSCFAMKPSSNHFQYGYAANDCAPWDGPATSIVLQSKPFLPPLKPEKPVRPQPSGESLPRIVYPAYFIHLWKNPVPWLPFDLKDDNGSLRYCESDRKCEIIQGSLRLTHQNSGHLSGTVTVDRTDPLTKVTTTTHYDFNVRKYANLQFCG